MYLGANVKKYVRQDSEGNDIHCHVMGSYSYVEKAVKIAKEAVAKVGLEFPTAKRQAECPFTNAQYRPELDIFVYCSPEEAT